jgi:hypothetical protein
VDGDYRVGWSPANKTNERKMFARAGLTHLSRVTMNNPYLEYREVCLYDHKAFYQLLEQFGYRLNKNHLATRTIIDWDAIENWSMQYHFEGDEDAIRNCLISSSLISHEFVLIEQGPNEPVARFKTEDFVKYWDDVLSNNGYMGTVVISENGKLIIEFPDDSAWVMHTNFKLL